jgi:hypothetical protein
MNPHRLPDNVSYWTSDPFLAMSVAESLGLKVGRYPSGKFILGMSADSSTEAYKNNWFGYGLLDPDGGFKLIDWQARKG